MLKLTGLAALGLALLSTAVSAANLRAASIGSSRAADDVSLRLGPMYSVVGSETNATYVAWDVKATPPAYFFTMSAADYHKLLRHEFDDVQVEPDYSCLVDNGCSSFAMAISLPPDLGQYYLVAYNADETGFTDITGTYTSSRDSSPYAPTGDRFRTRPIVISLRDGRPRRVQEPGSRLL